MPVERKPDLNDPKLREKLAKGLGHSTYGEPAWPNELIYVFGTVILGTIGLCVGLAVLDPVMRGEPANPFYTPQEILPEWYLYPTFQILRIIPSKLIGVLLIVAIPVGLLFLPFLENINKFQNPFRRPLATTIFLLSIIITMWLGIGALFPIEDSLTFGLY